MSQELCAPSLASDVYAPFSHSKFWTSIFYISQPNFMLISFSYYMLHFTWIAEMGKYLFFFLNLISKMNIQEDSSWKHLSLVGFQSVPGWWPGQ